jgi:enamine deaminase RidA (YjgF/YER057c/UK114 family)
MSRRKSVQAKGMVHKNPVPAACRIGNLIFSGVILGRDDRTGKYGADLDEQCALVFANMREIVEAGGGTVDDIAKVAVWMRDPTDRKILNQHWLKMFPDEQSRPARHTTALDADDGSFIRCEFTAVLDD